MIRGFKRLNVCMGDHCATTSRPLPTGHFMSDDSPLVDVIFFRRHNVSSRESLGVHQLLSKKVPQKGCLTLFVQGI